jgi:hypothetical protein
MERTFKEIVEAYVAERVAEQEQEQAGQRAFVADIICRFEEQIERLGLRALLNLGPAVADASRTGRVRAEGEVTLPWWPGERVTSSVSWSLALSEREREHLHIGLAYGEIIGLSASRQLRANATPEEAAHAVALVAVELARPLQKHLDDRAECLARETLRRAERQANEAHGRRGWAWLQVAMRQWAEIAAAAATIWVLFAIMAGR